MSTTTKNPARVCRIEDLFKVSDDAPSSLSDEVNAYLACFAAPVVRDGQQHCLSCDERIDAFADALGIGVAYRWGLAHGEARCTGCGWPARGMHRITGDDGRVIATIRNFFLAYHPDHVAAVDACKDAVA